MTTNQDKDVGSPDQYVGWQTYLERHHSQGGEIFSSRHSLEWFCRQNTILLIASGQYIPRRGPAGTLYGPRFTETALRILRKLSTDNRHHMTVQGSQDSSL